MKNPKTILITGASSGIGAALAQVYAQPGVHLYLSGRNKERLDSVASACRDKGAEVRADVIDVTDRFAMTDWISEIDSTSPLDLVIANAGISTGTTPNGHGQEEEQVRDIFAVNLAGVVNTLWPVITFMKKRQRGQIAVVSSLAGFRGMPGAPAYSASKAAVKAYGEALRIRLKENGIAVSVICPGFVESRITAANRFPMPMLWPADRAAAYIQKRLARNTGLIVFPWILATMTRLIAVLPPFIADPILARMPRKT